MYEGTYVVRIRKLVFAQKRPLSTREKFLLGSFSCINPQTSSVPGESTLLWNEREKARHMHQRIKLPMEKGTN
ncbi:unnamed protein product [Allacma fusca]|uniref:Uncharacterized protein n=1 Tax=Allacma fusca TaxID=39272 RepID=A0A8J2KFA1_9HEXA|nr:unnamed protein product [Allacma fusca]